MLQTWCRLYTCMPSSLKMRVFCHITTSHRVRGDGSDTNQIAHGQMTRTSSLLLCFLRVSDMDPERVDMEEDGW